MMLAVHAHGKLFQDALTEMKSVRRIVSLSDKKILVLSKKGLHLLNQRGETIAFLQIDAKHLDVRKQGNGMMAVMRDLDSQHLVSVFIDEVRGRIEMPTPLMKMKHEIEALCLYRDVQEYQHLFLIQEDGQSEEWLLSGSAPQRLRELSLPPNVTQCQADDRQHILYFAEKDVGVWGVHINTEAIPARHVVALSKPYGILAGGPGPFDVLPDGIAIKAAQDNGIYLLRYDGKGLWVKKKTYKARKGSEEQLLFSSRNSRGNRLYVWDVELEKMQQFAFGWHGATHSLFHHYVTPVVQTEPVATSGDAADDPAIWIHPTAPEKSVILGTNKKYGLMTYDLNGRQLQSMPSGRLNNVDVRQRVRVGHRQADLAVATRRDDNALVVYEIDTHGHLEKVAILPTDLKEIYGMCLGQEKDGVLNIFANDKNGQFRQYRLVNDVAGYSTKLVRTFSFASQVEGCVVDDDNQRLFVGEEKRGVWVMSSAAKDKVSPDLILPVGDRLVADVEGMAVLKNMDARYLVISSQGNDSYVVLDAVPPYRYRGTFRIGINLQKNIDGTSSTDGLDVTSANLGGVFEKGMLVVQDGHKRMPDGNQNFKYIPWSQVQQALGLQ